MDATSIVTASPRRLSFGRPGHDYELVDDLVAIHGPGDADAAVLAFEGDRVFVYRLDAVGDLPERGEVGPVYRRAHGGGVAVPTGRVLVRYGDGDRAEDHSQNLARAGYVVETTVSHAPQAVWVRARDDGIAEALSGLRRLEGLPGVEGVEPQMLSEAVRRR